MNAERFEHKKSLGQHFLNSDMVPRWLAEAGEVEAGDTVVEVGPGTGALTRELLARGATVIALEADERAITELQNTFAREIAAHQLILEHYDVREFHAADLGLADHGFKVVANIPYYLSGFLFRTFLESAVQPKCLVFLVQKEVAKRIASDLSRGEKESLLSLAVKLYGKPRYVRTVSRGHFTPPPKIDSGIICVQNISRKNLGTIPAAFFFDLLHLGFGQKRKQLMGNLSGTFDRAQLESVFKTLAISPTVRAEDLALSTWLNLAAALVEHEASTS